jgi:hypothetical protein
MTTATGISRYKTLEEIYKVGILQENPSCIRVIHVDFKSAILSAGVTSEIWNYSAAEDLTWPTTAETLTLVSDSIEDAAGGQGIDSAFVIGYDADLNRITETVTLNGLTPVTTTQQFYRLRRVENNNAPISEGSNVGNITISGTSTGNVYGQMEAGKGETFNSHFIIPAGFTGHIYKSMFSVRHPSSTSIREVEIDIKQKFFTAGVTSTYRFPVGTIGTRGSSSIRIEGPLQAWDLPAGTEICLEGVSPSNNTRITGSLQILLVASNSQGDFF